MKNDAEFNKKTEALEDAQAKYLQKVLPGYKQKWINWSKGRVQLLEIGNGPKLLFIHGGLGEAFQYATVMHHLSSKYKVLAIDRPGHGLSDPINYTGINLLKHSEEFISDIYKSEGIQKITIVASSMGGLWAVNYALQHPEKVEKIILLGSVAGITRKLPLSLRVGTLPILKHVIRSIMRKPTVDSVRGFWKQMLVAKPEKLDVDFLEASVASQARNAPSWFTLIDASMNIAGMRKYLLIGDRWKLLKVPVICIWGDKDVWAKPDVSAEIERLTNCFKTVIIQEAGHAPWFDNFEAAVKELDKALDASKAN